MKDFAKHVYQAEATWSNLQLNMHDVRRLMTHRLIDEVSSMVFDNCDMTEVESGEFSTSLRVKVVIIKEDEFFRAVNERAELLCQTKYGYGHQNEVVITSNKSKETP